MTVIEAIREELNAPVNADMAMDDLAIDSLEYLQMIVNLEKIFGIKIEEKDLEPVVTMGDLCRVVDGLRKANHKGIENYVSS